MTRDEEDEGRIDRENQSILPLLFADPLPKENEFAGVRELGI